jgi:phage replication-related protein YjqB (UPF0714/DUF867 family)
VRDPALHASAILSTALIPPACHGTFRSIASLESNIGVEEAYSITAIPRVSYFGLFAPHGGLIEIGSSELARALSGERYALYCFEGKTYPLDQNLRITSTHFDEPQCQKVLSSVAVPIVIHGCYEAGSVDLFLGGRALNLIDVLQEYLHAGDFVTAVHPQFMGISRKNICNRGTQGSGIQIELGWRAQNALFDPATDHERRYATRLIETLTLFLHDNEP